MSYKIILLQEDGALNYPEEDFQSLIDMEYIDSEYNLMRKGKLFVRNYKNDEAKPVSKIHELVSKIFNHVTINLNIGGNLF